MILVDTSVWIDHLRERDLLLETLLRANRVAAHAFVIGELSLGNLRQRGAVLQALQNLPQTVLASHGEVLRMIDLHALFGAGLGYIDAHLLASARLTQGAALWTRDRRLCDAAGRLAVCFTPG